MGEAISLDGPHWDNLIQALAHSLWQGALVSLLLLLALRTVSIRRPELRYGLACLAMFLILSAAASTYALLEFRDSLPVSSADASAIESLLGSAPQPEIPSDNPSLSNRSTAGTERNSPFALDWQRHIPALWLAGVATMLFRVLRLQWRAARFPSACTIVEDPTIIRLVRELARTLGVSPSVRVLATTTLTTPAVVGWLEPVILLPAACLAGVPDSVLRAAIAHELAHIRRHDFLINQIQLLVEALLFFNPAVWWVSRQIRIEREAACDAIAARAVGDELDYAKSLAAWAALGHGPAYALAVTGQQRGSVLERVRRLLDARYTPALMRSWAGAAVLSAAGLAILAALTGGSYWGTFILARALTPAERIAVLEEVVAQQGGEDIELDEHGSPRPVVPLRVRLKTGDGSTIPDTAKVGGAVELELSHSTIMTGFSMERSSEVGEGTAGGTLYETKATEGSAHIRASAPGYAPSFAGPIVLKEASPPREIEIVLTPGFTSGLRLLGVEGTPLRGVSVAGTYDVRNSGRSFDLVSDEEGVVRVEHCADAAIKWEVSAAGYETEIKVFKHRADAIETWELTAALPSTGVVLDEKSEAPMAEARIYEVAREGGPNPGSNNGLDSFPLIAQTDQQGHFSLDALRRDTRYWVMVESPEGGRAFFEEVRAGDENLEFKIASELSIRGTIRGALSRLPKFGDKLMLPIYTPFKAGDSTYFNHAEHVSLEVEGDSAAFQLEHMWKGHVAIELPDSRVEFDLTESRHDLDLVIPEEGESLTRDVILLFKGTDGVPPKGAIYVNYFKRLGGNSLDRVGPLSIDGEEIRLSMLVPNTVSLNPNGMLGYGFEDRYTEIPVGDDPFIVEIDTWPAGSIQVTVVKARNGSEGSPSLSVAVVTPAPPLLKGHYRPDVENVTRQDESVERFIATPVPLGGTYRLVASHGWNYAVSKEIRLSDRRPTAAVDLVLPEGVTFRGRVLSEAGEPLSGAQIGLSMNLDGAGSYSRSPGVTSSLDGSFEFTPVNPDLPGTYYLDVRGMGSFQSVRVLDVDVRDFLDVRLPVGFKVMGKVHRPDGSPASGVELKAFRDGGRGLTEECSSDAEGVFEFSNLAGDMYTLVGEGGKGWGFVQTRVDVNTTRHVELQGVDIESR